MRIAIIEFLCSQLRETHENEQEKAYQLKAQIIEVRLPIPPFHPPPSPAPPSPAPPPPAPPLSSPGWRGWAGSSPRLLQTGTPHGPRWAEEK